MRAYKKSRESARERALPCANLPLFDWQSRQELMSVPTVRTIARKAQVSPALAAVIADLCGLSRETR
jgi:hypothetical protein